MSKTTIGKALEQYTEKEIAGFARANFERFEAFSAELVRRGFSVLLEPTEEFHIFRSGIIRKTNIKIKKEI